MESGVYPSPTQEEDGDGRRLQEQIMIRPTLEELDKQIDETYSRIERKEVEFLCKPVEQHIKEILETTTNLTDGQIDRAIFGLKEFVERYAQIMRRPA